MRSNYFIPVLIICCFIGCTRGKTKLTAAELKWIDPYKEGDTLIFRSGKGEFDTSYIFKKEVFYGEANSIETGEYQHQWARIFYKNKKNYPDGHELITLIKPDPPKEANLFVNYLHSSFIAVEISNASQFKKGQVYEFDTYHSRAEADQPMKIYWHEEYGITRYMNHDSSIWDRINLPQPAQ